MNPEQIFNQIEKLLSKINEFNEDDIEDIIDFITDKLDEDHENDLDSDEEKELYESHVLSLKPKSAPVKPQPSQPSQSSQVSQPRSSQPNQPSQVSQPSQSSQSKSSQPQNNTLPKVIQKPTEASKSTVDPSVIFKQVKTLKTFDPQTVSTLQKFVNLNVQVSSEKKRTNILNFGETCKSFGLNIDVASSHLASAFGAKKAVQGNVLILSGEHDKQTVENTFKKVFSKK